MTCHIKQLLSISRFVLGVFFSNAAQAQCTPTLYLFRHAEDVPKAFPTALTSVGNTHAKLYPMMINQLETTLGAQSPCPLARVFAMWDRNTGSKPLGTTNPYQTALPLAQHVGGMSYVPEMFFTDTDQHKYYLCEYPVDQPCADAAGIVGNTSNHRNAYVLYSGDTNSHLYTYLSAYFQTHANVSVAIFHTSQGMPAVSWAFGVKPAVVNCPDSPRKCTAEVVPPQARTCPLPVSQATSEAPQAPCYDNENRLLSWPGAQRSSLNIFKYVNTPQNVFVRHYQSVSTNFTVDQNLLQVLEFSQCYNFNNTTQQLSAEYYCQYSGSLANGLKNSDSTTTLTIGKNDVPLAAIKAKICYPPFIAGNSPGVADSFGHCL